MFKIARYLLNNIDEKAYVKGKAKLKLSKNDGKIASELPRDASEYRRIEELETDYRYDNLSIYVHNMAKLRGKRACIFVLPVLLGSLTIFSWINKGYTKVEKLPTYEKKVIAMDEEHLYQDDYVEGQYVLTFISRTFLDKDAHNLTSDTGKAKIYYGEGEEAIQAYFDVDKSGGWRCSNYQESPYFNLDGKDVDNAQVIPEKYQDLISEASNIFKSQLRVDSKMYKRVEEILNNYENDIYVEITRYEYIGDLTHETSHSYWLWRILMIICDVVLVCLIGAHWDELLHNPALVNTGVTLKEGQDINIIHAVMKYREALYDAEECRIKKIAELLNENNGSDIILSEFEKKLLLK